ncbi:MAG: CinA family protein, partial [Gammaproteobacteria bacterium]
MNNDLISITENLAVQLIKKQWLLTTAESCTGGWIAETITSIAGSSKWFERGFVCYSNLAKQEMLGVAPDLILQHGAVSQEVAHALAAGAIKHSHAQVSIAVTGIAGPGGGSPTKPVGTVWFGWAYPTQDKLQ